MNKQTQNEMILDYLLSGNSLTPLEALDRFGCFRLSGRIYDLKKKGVLIDTHFLKTSNGKTVSSYSITNIKTQKNETI